MSPTDAFGKKCKCDSCLGTASKAGEDKKTNEDKKPYGGKHPDMQKLKRAVLCQTMDEWYTAGRDLQKRDNLIDLRCWNLPKGRVVEEAELDGILEADFDCIRVNHFNILRNIIAVSNIMETDKDWYKEERVPYVFWMPYTILLDLLPNFENQLKKLEKAEEERYLQVKLALPTMRMLI